jgi:hypothetical protein
MFHINCGSANLGMCFVILLQPKSQKSKSNMISLIPRIDDNNEIKLIVVVLKI